MWPPHLLNSWNVSGGRGYTKLKCVTRVQTSLGYKEKLFNCNAHFNLWHKKINIPLLNMNFPSCTPVILLAKWSYLNRALTEICLLRFLCLWTTYNARAHSHCARLILPRLTWNLRVATYWFEGIPFFPAMPLADSWSHAGVVLQNSLDFWACQWW